ncbi:non-specific lipid-transfer protein A-like [Aristolochia californica]|uniref:non-specific lipid-transfer protein A-like n=1 Tax=Aristolochia californica TaxID=171875 RepID=UPI0035DCCD4B
MVVLVRALLWLVIVGMLWGLGEAVPSCKDVQSDLMPCVAYVTGSADSPSGACCNGMKDLNKKVATRADRQAICRCCKKAASKVPGIDMNRVASLPKKCGVKTMIPIRRNDSVKRTTTGIRVLYELIDLPSMRYEKQTIEDDLLELVYILRGSFMS